MSVSHLWFYPGPIIGDEGVEEETKIALKFNYINQDTVAPFYLLCKGCLSAYVTKIHLLNRMGVGPTSAMATLTGNAF